MRPGSFGPFISPSGSNSQNRFPGSYLFRYTDKFQRIIHAFGIEHNGSCFIVFSVITEDFRDGYIRSVSIGSIHPLTDTHIVESLHDYGAHTAALGNHRDMAWFRVGEGEITVSIDRRIGVDDPLAVRANDPYPVFPRPGKGIILQRLAFSSHFLKSCCIDDDGFNPFLSAVLNLFRDERRRDHNVGKIYLSGDIQNRRIGFQPPDLIHFRVDGKHRTPEFIMEQVFDDDIPDREFLCRCTDQGY